MPIEPHAPVRDRHVGAIAAEGRHWFYDSRILVGAFCLLSFVAVFWQVGHFEGFRPIFTSASNADTDLDRGLLSMGMEACMEAARSRADQEHCMRTVYILACTKERWR